MTPKARLWIAIALVTAHVSMAPPARACTTFAAGRGARTLVGKSYDFDFGHGLVVVNKRGLSKRAELMRPDQGTPARWTARYASLTFNQYGRELPLGGINERGLVVEIMWLQQTRFGAPVKGRPTVNELQLIQHLLDTAATTAEAVAAARRLQVARIYGRVHYMACDAGGACATLEYLDGKLVVHQGAALPLRVLTNSTYARSLAAARRHRGLGGGRPTPGGSSSLARYTRAATLARRMRAPTVAGAFSVLESVRQSMTQWQIVYEPARRRVHFRLPGDRRHTTVELGKLELACKTPVRIMDIKGTVLEKRARWYPYTRKANTRLVRLSFKALKLRLPPGAVEGIGAYPERASCARAKETKF
jgi:choloylglycine hydrolase